MLRLARPSRIALIAVASLTACGETEAPLVDPVEHEIVVARDGARGLDAHIVISEGDLNLRGGGCPLMKATTRYDAERYEPRVEYWVDKSFRGKLDVSMADIGKGVRETTWNVCLTDALPTSLSIRQDKGDANLRLGNLQLDELQLELQVRKGTIDLVGRRYRNTKVKLVLDNVSSEVLLRIPKDVGVRVYESEKDPAGRPIPEPKLETTLRKTDEGYVNSSYGSTPVNLEIELSLQAGELKVETG